MSLFAEDGITIDYVAEKGHRLDTAHGRCIHCRTYAIDLYEDAAYGDVRECREALGDKDRVG